MSVLSGSSLPPPGKPWCSPDGSFAAQEVTHSSEVKLLFLKCWFSSHLIYFLCLDQFLKATVSYTKPNLLPGCKLLLLLQIHDKLSKAEKGQNSHRPCAHR